MHSCIHFHTYNLQFNVLANPESAIVFSLWPVWTLIDYAKTGTNRGHWDGPKIELWARGRTQQESRSLLGFWEIIRCIKLLCLLILDLGVLGNLFFFLLKIHKCTMDCNGMRWNSKRSHSLLSCLTLAAHMTRRNLKTSSERTLQH